MLQHYKIKRYLIISVIFISCGIFVLLVKLKPTGNSDLIPLRIPIDCDTLKPTVATFKVGWSEPHYVGFEMTQPNSKFADSVWHQTSTNIGSKVQRSSFDISWEVYEGDNLIGSHQNNDELSGLYGSTIALGSFKAIAGKTYRIVVQSGKDFLLFKNTTPVLEVGVATASAGVGLALVEDSVMLLKMIIGYILLIIGFILFIITLIQKIKQQHSPTSN